MRKEKKAPAAGKRPPGRPAKYKTEAERAQKKQEWYEKNRERINARNRERRRVAREARLAEKAKAVQTRERETAGRMTTWNRAPVKLKCVWCGADYVARSRASRYCSPACSAHRYRWEKLHGKGVAWPKPEPETKKEPEKKQEQRQPPGKDRTLTLREAVREIERINEVRRRKGKRCMTYGDWMTALRWGKPMV